jgi:acyl carrier protein
VTTAFLWFIFNRTLDKRKSLLTTQLKLLAIMADLDIAAKVKEIIKDKLSVDDADVREDASFTNDLGADSLDTVELIMDFEKEFKINIPDDQAEKISTVGDAIKYIEEHLQ